ncbi:hypothetical protein LMG3458_04686 [Achromobacter deleyi]|uniref:Uncharacterized protein n=1 Tax=Achromobacter deleyi TaxID=1353891 RepID=A0A6S7AP13_9BURK|nr:hypothetical protein [Achromobacter deleyi]CAB3729188.1 hypothetical protein LMG3458_04686 [Achromobacter deleyi]CAB3867088.1 hypothetical protein LMG3481_02558 [Achromobacter deleyi]CAB3913618.1 hypothetical protein LMG3482_04964 [Achromobacter deleyi]
MSAQTCLSISPPFGAATGAATGAVASAAIGSSGAARPQPASPEVQLAAAAPATVTAQAEPQSASRGGILSRLWRAYRQRRAEAVLRNLADEMDAHMLKDVGAPQWLVNETTREQALKRITSIDNLRW